MPNLSQQIAQTGNCFREPPKVKKGAKRLRSASPKRAKQLAEYRVKRIAFLKKHPYCQIWMKLAGVRRSDIDEDGCILDGGYTFVPRSKEIHHRAGRIGEKLLDEKDWLAASREMHDWCHKNPSEARKRGLLV